jgi:hypothetical protein
MSNGHYHPNTLWNTVHRDDNVKLHISHRSGSEGPRHDPYHFDEFSVSLGVCSITVHVGLGEWIEVKPKAEPGQWPEPRGDRRSFSSWEELDATLKSLTGLSMEQLQSWEDEAHTPPEQCPQCGSELKVLGHGYAGECIIGCTREGCNYAWEEPINLSNIE